MNRPRNIADPDFSHLARAASALEPDYGEDLSDWEESPFVWIRLCPSARRGAIGKLLVADWLRAQGLLVESCDDSGVDYIVNNERIAVKFSTLWKGGFYRFQQIRDQNYDLLFCLGISPYSAHAWVFTKAFLLDGWGNLDGFTSQHRGRAGVDTAWIRVEPTAPQAWLAPHGGTLRDAFDLLSRLLFE